MDKTALYNSEIVVERNGITLVLPWAPYKRGEKKKAGEQFPSFVVTAENYEAVSKWNGLENQIASVTQDLNLSSQQITQTVQEELVKLSSLEEGSGEWVSKFNDLYVKYMSALTTRGESKASLLAQNEALSREIVQLGTSNNDVTERLISGTATEADKQVIRDTRKRMLELQAQIQKNSEAIETKKRRKEVDDEETEPTATANA